MGKREIIIGAFLMALSAVFFVLTFDFPEQTLAFSPKIFPRFVSACLFLMSLLLVIQAVNTLRKTRQESEPTSEKALDKAYLMRLSSGLIIGYAYTQILPLTG
ncbi:MAG: tripartite tricarboxylate transporter TctB family protein, partial [Desulfarculaceae bacterium]